jgi:tetratricopeptide (TPR) repeat protein
VILFAGLDNDGSRLHLLWTMARHQLREPSDEWELIEAREVHVVDALKQEGNLLFQQQRYFDAIQTYGRALAQIQSIDVANSSHEDGESLEQLETAVRLNRALAYIELQDANLLAYAEEDCSIVLVRQPQCVKALYRRALARERLGKLEVSKAVHILLPCLTSDHDECLGAWIESAVGCWADVRTRASEPGRAATPGSTARSLVQRTRPVASC